MDAEQMELLERLARLRGLGAIGRREFAREKESILRAPPRPAPVLLRALPPPGAAVEGGSAAPVAAGAVLSVAAPPRRHGSLLAPDHSLLARAGGAGGWILWTLFSIGGLDALLRHDALEALALLLCGLLLAPPFHRLLATRMSLPSRLMLTALGAALALGIGSARPAGASPRLANSATTACGEVVTHVVGERGERAREGIARPWRKFWSDLAWARVAGVSLYDEWRSSRG
jgi:hypothetical protein